jgi:hypothetical protein
VTLKTYVLEPDGWPQTLAECPPGFFEFKGSFGLKSEYGPLEAFCDSGEAFWGGAKTTDERRALLVQPCAVTEREIPA